LPLAAADGPPDSPPPPAEAGPAAGVAASFGVENASGVALTFMGGKVLIIQSRIQLLIQLSI
jgi:hypothetical protein